VIQVGLCNCKIAKGYSNLSTIDISSSIEDYDQDFNDDDWQPGLTQGLA